MKKSVLELPVEPFLRLNFPVFSWICASCSFWILPWNSISIFLTHRWWWASTIKEKWTGKKKFLPTSGPPQSLLARLALMMGGSSVNGTCLRPRKILSIRVLSCMWGIWHIMLTCFFWLAQPHTETSTNPVCDLQIVELPTLVEVEVAVSMTIPCPIFDGNILWLSSTTRWVST